MDSRLEEKLKRWHDHLEKMKDFEFRCLSLEGSEKAFFSQILLKQQGSTVSEREAKAYASQEWAEFSTGLASVKSQYNHEKRRLELLQKAFDAEYLTYKLESDLIKRAG